MRAARPSLLVGALAGALLAAFAALAAGCRPSIEPGAALPPPACRALRVEAVPDDVSLVLVLNDAMRRDRIGAYGGSADTPHLDAFARRHLLFRHASSAAPWTKPAVASLFTAHHPSQHGVLTHPGAGWSRAATPETDALPAAFDTLAEVLRRAGFRTAAFVANPWMEPGFGYEQGFEVYDAGFAAWDAPAATVFDAGLEWIASLDAGERFFLYLHTIDSHLPYGRLTRDDLEAAREQPDPRPVPAEARRYLLGLRAWDGRTLVFHDVPLGLGLLETAYDRGVEAFDRAFGNLLEARESHPALARAAWVVTSDHGEALFERGWGNHARALYEEELAIPLIADLPGVRPERGAIDCPVGLVDLMPALCHSLGVPCPASLAGRSFLSGGAAAGGPAAGGDGAGPPRYLVSEGVPRFEDHRSVRNARFKLVHAPGGPNIEGLGLPDATPDHPDALYDLVADPGETRDLLDTPFPGRDVERVARRMREGLDAAVPPVEVEGRKVPVAPGARERLRALGYFDE